jgi:SAM-dependent methyltransferase
MKKIMPLSSVAEEILADALMFAKETNCTSALHPEDFIFQFLINNPVFKEKSSAIRYYFEDGLKSAKQLDELIREFGIDSSACPKILEFASGYGCVTRHFKNCLTYAKTVSCDIHLTAVDFIQTKIGEEAVISQKLPELLSVSNDFDVVFALSFFSHMPRATWQRWLIALYGCLKPGGLLIFTTHGVESAKKFLGNPQIPKDGFWFSQQSEQHDLSKDDYGTTVVTEAFVLDQLQYLPGYILLNSRPAYWWGHQDTYIIKYQP